MLPASVGGNRVPVIAQLIPADEDTAREVIHRFDESGLACLDPRRAGGRPRPLRRRGITFQRTRTWKESPAPDARPSRTASRRCWTASRTGFSPSAGSGRWASGPSRAPAGRSGASSSCASPRPKLTSARCGSSPWPAPTTAATPRGPGPARLPAPAQRPRPPPRRTRRPAQGTRPHPQREGIRR
ncbi:helix-turn-helix domain-containing protein [Streptomyces sp. NPDC093808]|uniref:helix-turn-helix domain-containing protein n=1 Tax=Streptomyces sp. NPDC093808 TaxID=3154985 RepID=UPI00344CFC6F